MKNQNTGRLRFTLIELLVVVLIVGILIAVALPQYNKAVENTQLMMMVQLIKPIAAAKQAHFLETEEYARKFEELSVTLPDHFSILDDNYYGQIASWKKHIFY